MIDLFTYKYSHIFIDCTPTAPISADGRTLLELAVSLKFSSTFHYITEEEKILKEQKNIIINL